MGTRINMFEKGQNAMKSLTGIGGYLANYSVDQSLLNLVYFRVSQINGCAFCLDMHAKDLRANGETEQRIFTISAWRETPFFSMKERAALLWAEAVTDCNVPDDIYEEVQKQFSGGELIDLTLAVTAINTYNRINIAFNPVVGTYQVGQFK